MPDDFSKYELMRDTGSKAEAVYLATVRDGVDPIARIRLIRAVYSLSPREAKEVIVRAEGLAHSLDEFQGRIAGNLSKASQPSCAERRARQEGEEKETA